ncbi:MAG: hypothetical protein MMC33_001497 [Icmadophila ericetorum]|nr:hypothetical protein [Icmadophila ericetorum]
MEHIDASSLSDLPSRLSYTLSFLAFTPETDGASINVSAATLGPLIPTVLDLVYTKLLSYDITAKPFTPQTQPEEIEKEAAPKTPKELHLEHAHILRQKTFLKNYLLKICTTEDWSPNSKLWIYMDHVALMHTGVQRGKRPELRVEYTHLALLLGYVVDIVAGAVLGAEGLDLETKGKVIKAWNKVVWIQNDLFARKYTVDRETGEQPVGVKSEKVTPFNKEFSAALVGVVLGVWLVVLYNAYFLRK